MKGVLNGAISPDKRFIKINGVWTYIKHPRIKVLNPTRNDPTYQSRKNLEYKLRRQTKIFEIYGKRCVCCGEDNPLFLTLDHINNNGAKHRKETKSGNYDDMIKNPNKSKYQILCHNCNSGKHRGHGICPHNITIEQPKTILQRYYTRLWDKIFNIYGNKCVCCGERNRLFLTVDHINNDGSTHRKRVGGSHNAIKDIISSKDKTKYQILCYNCNCGRERNHGICPHKN